MYITCCDNDENETQFTAMDTFRVWTDLVEFFHLCFSPIQFQMWSPLLEGISLLNHPFGIGLADVVAFLVAEAAMPHGEEAAVQVLVLRIEGLGGQLCHPLVQADILEEPLGPLEQLVSIVALQSSNEAEADGSEALHELIALLLPGTGVRHTRG